MPKPEHVQQLEKAIDDVQIVVDTMFAPELARSTFECFNLPQVSREQRLTVFADVGAIPLHRALIEAGYFDDKPELAAKHSATIERSGLGFQQILEAAIRYDEARRGIEEGERGA